MQETQVWSLMQEDPTCPEQLNPCATTTESVLWSQGAVNTETHVPRTQQEKPWQWEAPAPQLECSPHSSQLDKSPQRPATGKKQKQKPLPLEGLLWMLPCKLQVSGQILFYSKKSLFAYLFSNWLIKSNFLDYLNLERSMIHFLKESFKFIFYNFFLMWEWLPV